MAIATSRFPIRFDPWYRALSTSLLLSPSSSYVDVLGDQVAVRMAWAFRARFPRSAVVSAAAQQRTPLARGVHSFAGRWLINGSGEGIVAIDLAPRQRAFVIGFPVKLRQLLVSVEDPEGLIEALAAT